MTSPDSAPLRDVLEKRHILDREHVFTGKIWDVVRESFELSEADSAPIVREYIDHPGAVAIVTVDEQDRVLLLRQYRHPVRASLWEIPAGLLDIVGEDPQVGAARELAEEADLVAENWRVLVDVYNSAGSSSEAVRTYLAWGLSSVPEDQRHQRTEEESEIILRWVPLDEAVTAVLEGRIHSFSAISGILALRAAKESPEGIQGLRASTAPWREHPSQRLSQLG